MPVLALCPSRGRPRQAAELLESFNATKTDPASRLLFLLDADDPTLGQYEGERHVGRPSGCMGIPLYKAGRNPAILGDATVVGMVGDDNRFRTRGWDKRLMAVGPTAIMYGDDGFQHERLPTSWWVTRDIVNILGIVDVGLRHYYMDNVWKDLGQGAGCLYYLPDVVIEHMHPLAGKGQDDAIYRRAGANAVSDRQHYRRWSQSTRLDQVRKIRQLRQGPRRVLADWHHPALWESLSILFEDRFGWELYSPLGMEWAKHGWSFEAKVDGWRIPDYLEHPKAKRADDHYTLVEREYPERPRKLVTWQQAQSQRWDYVLASVSAHQRSFANLARDFGAQFIHQVGNAKHPIERSVPQVVLASAMIAPRPSMVTYHQEFNRELFKYSDPEPHLGEPKVRSFMLRLESTSCQWDWIKGATDWQDVGGHDLRNGHYLAPMTKVAKAMAGADWIWHDKRIGDGYGHVVHNAAALGRPLIGHASHYKGLLAEPYWRDLETCIDLDRHSQHRALRLIKAIAKDPEWLAEMGENIRATFDKRVDFDAEAEQIRAVLG